MPDDHSLIGEPPASDELANMTRDRTLQAARDPRVMRVVAAAIVTVGSDAKAWRWLERPTSLLDDVSPLSIIETAGGVERIEQILGRIDHGLAV